jgi:superfamily I DNA/RNA helicase
VKEFYNRLDRKTANPVQMYLSDMPPGKRRVDFSTPGVKVITWASTKGLEFDTVFLPELQQYRYQDPAADLFRKKMYVLTSRAKKELFFLYSGEGKPPILDALPLGDLDDWR